MGYIYSPRGELPVIDPNEYYYLEEIGRYIYAGDTALHVAAAAYRTEIVQELVLKGANVRARNRRGAQPLHSAAAGMPGSPGWSPCGATSTTR